MPLWTYQKPPTWYKPEDSVASDGGGPSPGHCPGWYKTPNGNDPNHVGELLVCIHIPNYPGDKCRIDLEGDNIVDDLLLETGDEFLLEVCPI